MATNYVLVIAIVVLVAAGTVLVLERSLSRILIGFVMLGNGVNLTYLVASGPSGDAPIIGMDSGTGNGEMTDPLPQAMVLTAIVITLGVTAFGLALAYRAWQLTGHDDVQDDLEDDLVRRRADLDHPSASFDDIAAGIPDEEGEDQPSEPTGVSDEELAADIEAEDAPEEEAVSRSQWVDPRERGTTRHTEQDDTTTGEGGVATKADPRDPDLHDTERPVTEEER